MGKTWTVVQLLLWCDSDWGVGGCGFGGSSLPLMPVANIAVRIVWVESISLRSDCCDIASMELVCMCSPYTARDRFWSRVRLRSNKSFSHSFSQSLLHFQIVGLHENSAENAPQNICLSTWKFINSFSILSYAWFKASSKASSPRSAIQSFLLQMRVYSHFLKIIQ